MPEKSDLVKEYREVHRPIFEGFASRVASLIEDLLTGAQIPFSQIENRAKTVESFLEKINRKGYKNPISEMKDLAGIRVITYYHDDVQRVADLLHHEFDVDTEHSTDKATELAVDEFGYRSFHLVCQLSARRRTLAEWNRFATLTSEIQVRSVLQHAWAAISHKIDYKSAAEAPVELQRQLFRLSALLELTDDQFADLRDRSAILSSKYRKDVERGALDIPLNLDSLMQYVDERVDLNEWEAIGLSAGMKEPETTEEMDRLSVGKLLETAQAIGMRSINEVDEVISSLRAGAQKLLEPLVKEVDRQGDRFEAAPVDVINATITLGERHRLPDDFVWTDPWTDEIQSAIKKLLNRKVSAGRP